jgi:CubicO group peptidase (beta-lactamase class C family)
LTGSEGIKDMDMRDRAWEAIPAALQASVDDGALAGLVTLAWRQGEIAQLNTVGFANIAAGAPMRRDTIFRIASMSKPITSLVALMLVEEGKLGLDDPITRWMPEFAGMLVLDDPAGPVSHASPAPRDITVEDLMTHRSGIAYNFTSAPALWRAYDERLGGVNSPLGADEWLAALASLPLTYPPGERFHYGHSTDVLGFLLARIEGVSLGEVLQARVFGPLGMGDTAFWVPAEKRGRLAALYRAAHPGQGGGLKDVSPPVSDTPPAPGAFESGGGGLFSTVDDYLTFARLLLGRGEVDGVRLVGPGTVDLMAANRLTAQQRAVPAFGLPFWASQGFGLGLAVITDPEKHRLMGEGAAGAFGWPGAYGTWWQGDPANDVILIYLIQDAMSLSNAAVTAGPQRPAGRMVLPAFQKLTYQALAS